MLLRSVLSRPVEERRAEQSITHLFFLFCLAGYEGEAGVLIQLLRDIQNEFKWVPKEAIAWISTRLQIPLSHIYRIVSFYKVLSLEPIGRQVIQVCLGTACHVRGGPRILDDVETLLKIKAGMTTEENLKFTVKRVNCIGCGDFRPLLLPYTHTDNGVSVDIEPAYPREIEPELPPGTDLSDAIVITVNVVDDTQANPTDDAYTDITIDVGVLDVETCRVYKAGFGFLAEVDEVTTLPTVKPPGEAAFARDVANNSIIVRLYVEDPILGVLPSLEQKFFDTGPGTYPSISSVHNGTITPNQTINVSKLYTYPCLGTGGHTEYVQIWNGTGWNVTATWNGYVEDWHNLTFTESFILRENETYNYTIRTGSYPQIIHSDTVLTAKGWIHCTEFTDANGRMYSNWIPAFKLS